MQAFRATLKGFFWLLLAAGGVAAPGAAAEIGEGEFIIREASDTRLNDVYYIDAQIDYGLNEEAVDALLNGVPLRFDVRVNVVERRRYFLDDTVHTVHSRNELSYHALTQRYVLRNTNSGAQTTFSTMAAALREMGNIERLPVLDAALLNERKRYRFELRTSLEVESSGPLQVLTSLFWFNDWRIKSEWRRWALIHKTNAD